MKFNITLVVVAVTAFGFQSDARSQSSGTTTIHLRWTESLDRIQPDPMNNMTFDRATTLILEPGGRITQRKAVAFQGRARSGATYNREEAAQIGRNWRAVNASTLVRTDVWPNNVREYRVAVSGQSCSLSITDTLKPGAEYYRFAMFAQPGRAGRYVNVRTSNKTCSIE
jgi:hypothetical protein